jgi:6,7-dimethyl-8-ribityllumazine synthase
MATRHQTNVISLPALDANTSHHVGADDATDLHVAIVVAQFHGDITSKLLAGALETYIACNTDPANITIVEVPGAWELPQAAGRLAQSKRFDAILALGVVIRGDTPHFDYVCNEASRGLMEVSLQNDCVVTFGLLTTDNLKQALARIGGEHGHKGKETALASIQMANLFRKKL